MNSLYAEIVTGLLTVVAPLTGVPLAAITFYLRALRDQQRETAAELIRRMDSVERAAAVLQTRLTDLERLYTPREEWRREVEHGRVRFDRLAAALVQRIGQGESVAAVASN